MKKIINYFLKTFGYRLIRRNIINLDIRQIKNLFYYKKIFSYIEHIEGDVVECGVGKGRSFTYLSSLAFFEDKNRKIWGFDSFQGFPEPTREDYGSDRIPRKGEWSGVSVNDINDTLLNVGLPNNFLNDNITLNKGFFEETTKNYIGSPIALLHIDVDLYQSYKICLEKFYPLLKTGGVVLFDEYKSTKWPGATKAINEYFGKDVKNFQKDELSGKYYFIKR